jgi:hypothetical protein
MESPERDQQRNRLREVLYTRSQDAVIRVYDPAGNVIETHEHKGRLQRVVKRSRYEIELTANSCIALSSSKNAVSFSSPRTT